MTTLILCLVLRHVRALRARTSRVALVPIPVVSGRARAAR
jgi:hypothetical protein